MKYQKFIIAILISAAALLQGCASRTIKIDPIPELKIGSPLAGIEPLTFRINDFEDVRPLKKQVGACRVGPRIELDEQMVTDIIVQAMSNELKRNGHKVLKAGDAGNVDVIIDGTVRKYWIQSDNYAFSIKITGTVETEINIAATNTDKPLTKTYRGEYYYETGFSITPSVWRDVINRALLEMLKEFTTDEEFLSRIKSIKRQAI